MKYQKLRVQWYHVPQHPDQIFENHANFSGTVGIEPDVGLQLSQAVAVRATEVINSRSMMF